ncbi:ankyrin repeat domain-containing protein [Flavobacterium salilacus subsp. salilacus]|uniref:ankyrin repeat domain-containing protein n=1 Tax=Flavobacterium TaxID=237 RepID=UPI001074B181|nr:MULTISPECIES: ankyrin repeat domain-containing protein [Flavobacterium]KAF2516301.1 ankyrin repeat domain-containing protein [Flavobacterium salilacus subsp. salilacus]MBE1613832.1 ankyrin repeat domain-containing protein [Flavobacterium sp. SaA2.13]NDI99919.1 ankyrin repeat domain-containing protein [Flavobacterium salilacus subsp. altitudinum]
MKKTIIYLSLALVAFSSATFATNVKSVPSFELVGEYNMTTPLGMAICKGDLETVKKFIEYGANVNEKSNGLTPLMLAARYNRVDIIKVLLENGANISLEDERGFTALKYAELSNAKEAVSVLKEASA